MSISLKFYKELQSHGADSVLQREYGDMIVAPEEGRQRAGPKVDNILLCYLQGFDVTVQIDLGNIPDNWEEIVKKCGLLKRNCFAAVFEKYFGWNKAKGIYLEESVDRSIFARKG